MTELYQEQKLAFTESKATGDILMNSLVRSSIRDEKNAAMCSENDRDGGLTESEIYGNMFVFNFAGHDTTAHSLAFAIALLATQPDVQRWVSVEIKHVLGNRTLDQLDYHSDFHKFTRCLSVLHETIRLLPPVPIAKSTGPKPSALNINEREIVLPANIMVIPSYIAMHTHPKYWGNDALDWRPTRWIERTPGVQGIAGERLILPDKGTFIAWSEGVRNCPGKKFSQVEFVAALVCLFHEWRVDPVPEQGETMAEARARVKHLVEHDTGQVLLLQMLHPEKAAMKWSLAE